MLVIRFIICLLIVGICTVIGIKKAKRYETREKIIREAIMLFRGIESEIKYTLLPLPNAIESVRQSMKTYLKDVMGGISTELIQTNYNEESVVNQIDLLGALDSYDKQIIANGIITLGKSDVESQVGIINMTCNSLESRLTESIEEKNKNSKLYKTVGIATGLIIAIVFV